MPQKKGRAMPISHTTNLPVSLPPFKTALQELIWPTRCLGCDAPGELLCPACKEKLAFINQADACPICGAPWGKLVCTECLHQWTHYKAICAVDFQSISARIVRGFKDGHELRLSSIIAATMHQALLRAQAQGLAPPDFIQEIDAIAFVPATSQAYMQRGYDHMERVAQDLAQLLHVPLGDVLIRLAKTDQRDLSKAERESNEGVCVEVAGNIEGATILLIDDVMTTGSTLRLCSEKLYGAGAQFVVCCAFARVW